MKVHIFYIALVAILRAGKAHIDDCTVEKVCTDPNDWVNFKKPLCTEVVSYPERGKRDQQEVKKELTALEALEHELWLLITQPSEESTQTLTSENLTWTPLHSEAQTLPASSSQEFTLPSPTIEDFTLPSPTSEVFTLPSPTSEVFTLPSPTNEAFTLPSPTSEAFTLPSPTSEAISLPPTPSQAQDEPLIRPKVEKLQPRRAQAAIPKAQQVKTEKDSPQQSTEETSKGKRQAIREAITRGRRSSREGPSGGRRSTPKEETPKEGEPKEEAQERKKAKTDGGKAKLKPPSLFKKTEYQPGQQVEKKELQYIYFTSQCQLKIHQCMDKEIYKVPSEYFFTPDDPRICEDVQERGLEVYEF